MIIFGIYGDLRFLPREQTFPVLLCESASEYPHVCFSFQYISISIHCEGKNTLPLKHASSNRFIAAVRKTATVKCGSERLVHTSSRLCWIPLATHPINDSL